MLTRHVARAATVPVVAAALTAGLLTRALAGCSHASGPSAAATAPPRTKGSVVEGSATFCSFLESLNVIATKARSQQQGLQLLAAIMPRLQAQRATAPAPVAAEFVTVADAAAQAHARGNLSPLATNQVAAAGTRLAAYCHSRS